MIDKMIHPSEKGFRWFVYFADNGHVLAQGYHRSAVIAGKQMDTTYLQMQDEFGGKS